MAEQLRNQSVAPQRRTAEIGDPGVPTPGLTQRCIAVTCTVCTASPRRR
jgi:hypothetical protein